MVICGWSVGRSVVLGGQEGARSEAGILGGLRCYV